MFCGKCGKENNDEIKFCQNCGSVLESVEHSAPLLTKAVTDAGTAFESIPFSQLILVLAHGSSADLRCYEKGYSAVWQLRESLGVMSGFVGRNGVSVSKKEGDGCSPAGLFRLGDAFGTVEKPETKMAYRRITENSFWVDDPSSCHYNTWVEGEHKADWSSAEHLSDYPGEYAYAVVIEYNTSAQTPGKGSAVFLHCGHRPTSGCIAVPEPTLLHILKWLEPEKSPGILIANI